jgi:hypothetical protein
MTARIGLVACEIFKKELERLTEDDESIVHKEYLEFALHVDPQEMRRVLVERVNSLKGTVDSVFLAYGFCQSLMGITNELDVGTVMLEVEDCIAALLLPQEYAREKNRCPGTWFSTPGWAEMGIDGVIKELHLDCMVDQGHQPEEFLEMIFDGYSRCLYVHTDVGERERYERLSEGFARTLGLHHECAEGSMEMLREGLERAKRLAMRGRA